MILVLGVSFQKNEMYENLQVLLLKEALYMLIIPANVTTLSI